MAAGHSPARAKIGPKLQEEAGEVAEAFLALRGVQRQDKLGQPEHELKASLGREISDVTVVMALLADAIGLAIDEIVLERIDELRARRENLLPEANPKPAKPAYKPDVPLPTEVDNREQLGPFSD